MTDSLSPLERELASAICDMLDDRHSDSSGELFSHFSNSAMYAVGLLQPLGLIELTCQPDEYSRAISWRWTTKRDELRWSADEREGGKE